MPPTPHLVSIRDHHPSISRRLDLFAEQHRDLDPHLDPFHLYHSCPAAGFSFASSSRRTASKCLLLIKSCRSFSASWTRTSFELNGKKSTIDSSRGGLGMAIGSPHYCSSHSNLPLFLVKSRSALRPTRNSISAPIRGNFSATTPHRGERMDRNSGSSKRIATSYFLQRIFPSLVLFA
jgi:hypothetical protein